MCTVLVKELSAEMLKSSLGAFPCKVFNDGNRADVTPSGNGVDGFDVAIQPWILVESLLVHFPCLLGTRGAGVTE